MTPDTPRPAAPAADYVSVPRVLTEEMIRTFHDRILIACNARYKSASVLNLKKLWEAMIAAAPTPPAASEGADNFGLSPDKIARLLESTLKPEAISGDAATQQERVDELLHWFARFADGNANSKWAMQHAYELAYYIATNGMNRRIDVSAIRQAGFIEGCNITPQERSLLQRTGAIATATPEAGKVDEAMVERAAKAIKYSRHGHLLDGDAPEELARAALAAAGLAGGEGAELRAKIAALADFWSKPSDAVAYPEATVSQCGARLRELLSAHPESAARQDAVAWALYSGSELLNVYVHRSRADEAFLRLRVSGIDADRPARLEPLYAAPVAAPQQAGEGVCDACDGTGEVCDGEGIVHPCNRGCMTPEYRAQLITATQEPDHG